MLVWLGLSEGAGWWILLSSVGMVGLALIAVPMVIVRIPEDYFTHPQRGGGASSRRCHWFRWIWLVVKNLLGLACLFFGALMLVLPGQGILTILLGVTLLDFPGKYRLQRWVVSRRTVLDAINWVRKRRGRAPLVLKHFAEDGSR